MVAPVRIASCHFAVSIYAPHKLAPPVRETGTGAIGVDFGTLTAIACSDGTKIENPRFLGATSEKIKTASKQKRRKRAPNFKKKVKGSKRWKKAQRRAVASKTEM